MERDHVICLWLLVILELKDLLILFIGILSVQMQNESVGYNELNVLLSQTSTFCTDKLVMCLFLQWILSANVLKSKNVNVNIGKSNWSYPWICEDRENLQFVYVQKGKERIKKYSYKFSISIAAILEPRFWSTT